MTCCRAKVSAKMIHAQFTGAEPPAWSTATINHARRIPEQRPGRVTRHLTLQLLKSLLEIDILLRV